MICKNCGKPIDADSQFCMYCGTEQKSILSHHKSHYSEQEINSLSWFEYNKLMADELNENGYKKFNIGRFKVSEPELYNPTYPLMIDISRQEELNFLIKKGLVNNGRCPRCGRPIKPRHQGKYTFTSGTYKDITYHICKDCYYEGMNISVNPAQQQGCVLALLLLPYNLFINIFQL